MRLKLLILTFILSSGFLVAQNNHEKCGFIKANGFDTEDGKKRLDLFEQVIQHKIAQNRLAGKNQRTTGVVYKIPVIVHVVHNGESIGTGSNINAAQVYSQIEVINEDFRKLNTDLNQTRAVFLNLAGDAEIEFVLATEDPNGNPLPEPGIHRYEFNGSNFTISQIEELIKPATSWNPSRYANFWTVESIVSSLGDVLGYAQFPKPIVSGLPSSGTDNITDGVVMGHRFFGSSDKFPQGNLGAPYDLGRTTTHEIGHWLGLRHIWGDGPCGASDFVNDTPDQESQYGGCPADTATSCGSLDMHENFMDYSNDACLTLFTEGQVERMRTVMELDDRRQGLANSTVAVTETLPNTPFNAPVYSYDVSLCGVTFKSDAYVAISNEVASSISWTFENGSIATSTDEVVEVEFPIGTHEVTLTMTSSLGTSSVTFNVTIGEGGIANLPLAEDFSGGLPASWVSDGNLWVTGTVNAPNDQVVGINNIFNNHSGTPKNLRTQLLNTTATKHLQIDFEVSYAYRSDGTTNTYDSLALLLSNGCTQSIKFWQKGGEELSTTAPTDASYEPTDASQWRAETAIVEVPTDWDVSALVFSNLGFFGNNIYIDNVNIKELQFGLDLNIGASDTLVCDQANTTLSANITDADTYEWTKVGSSTVLGTSSSLLITETGTYQLSATKGVDQGFSSAQVTFGSTPVADFFYSVNNGSLIATFFNQSTNGESYVWDFGDGKSSISTSPTHFYDDFGDFTATLIATSVCGSDTTSQFMTEIASLESNVLSQQIGLFPNPNQGQFVIDFSQAGSFKQAGIEVYDMTGRLVFQNNSTFTPQKKIDLKLQAKGMYFVKINLDGNLALKRVLVE